MAFVYKIRNKTTGLFSTGGAWPNWSKKGKLWTGLGPLANHLGLVRDNAYKDAELVTFELIEQIVDVQTIAEANENRIQRKKDREDARQARRDALRLERDRAEYERLKKQFG